MHLARDIEKAYRQLSLQTGADLKQVKAAYHHLAKAHHPDLNPQDQGRRMQRINRAYQLLVNHLRSQKGVKDYKLNELEPEPTAKRAHSYWSFFQKAAQTAARAVRADQARNRANGPLNGPETVTVNGLVARSRLPLPSLGPLAQKPEPDWRLLGITKKDDTLIYKAEVKSGLTKMTLPVRRQQDCRQCRGYGLHEIRGRYVACPACGGRGLITRSDQVTVDLPRDWTPGQTLTVPTGEGGENILVQLVPPASGKEI